MIDILNLENYLLEAADKSEILADEEKDELKSLVHSAASAAYRTVVLVARGAYPKEVLTMDVDEFQKYRDNREVQKN